MSVSQSAPSAPVTKRGGPGGRTQRNDRWWLYPAVTFTVFVAFIVYSTWAAFVNDNYYAGDLPGDDKRQYLSPLYAPCLAASCPDEVRLGPGLQILGWDWISPALYILIFPLGFRLTCYYYRKAYYRSFWLSPPACAVAEPHKRYTGETRFPLIGQNIHRYFFWAALVINGFLIWEAALAFGFEDGFGMGLGTLIMCINAFLLLMYSLSCHSCRHIMGGRLNHFSKHPVRYKLWTWVSRFNGHHAKWAWVSLVFVAFTDLYIRLVSAGVFVDPRFF